MDIMKYAKEQYEALGIDVDAVVSKLKQVPISLHCWQGDDVGGFESPAGFQKYRQIIVVFKVMRQVRPYSRYASLIYIFPPVVSNLRPLMFFCQP